VLRDLFWAHGMQDAIRGLSMYKFFKFDSGAFLMNQIYCLHKNDFNHTTKILPGYNKK